jgi:large conductance mechanosensitive channel
MWKDFKAFALKGNAIDLAIGVVIGAAFAKIVSALVDAIIMPLVSKVLPSGSYLTWAPGGVKVGLLIGAMIDFVIVAAVLFVIVVGIKRATAKPQPPTPPAELPPELKLLTEIRDLLAKR